ncbi:MAG: hypothetical protein HRU38_03745 [Saccharospirillaceae bacterium]|nr:hypothetical protein [Pseudomonadales bacterium]NRB77777.1 hypothetical protein [Saccharospirillaceae bacterium]
MLSIIVSGLIWIVQPVKSGQIEGLSDSIIISKDVKQKSIRVDVIDVAFEVKQPDKDEALALKEGLIEQDSYIQSLRESEFSSGVQSSSWLRSNQMLSPGAEAGSHEAYITQQNIVEERNQSLDELYHLRGEEDETNWKNDPDLERLALLHLKQGLSDSDLNTLFSRRYEKDVTNLVVVLPLYEYFYPADQYKESSAKLMIEKGIHLGRSKLKLLKYEFTSSKIFNLKLDKMFHFGNKTVIKDLNAVEFDYPAWQLMYEKTFFESDPYSINPDILALLATKNSNSSNARVRVFSLMIERFLISEVTLLNWILVGQDQFLSCKKCSWLVYFALDMELSQRQWMQLFEYILPEQYADVVRVITRLENYENVDALLMWQDLTASFPELRSEDPFSVNIDFPLELIKYNDNEQMEIQVLWSEYFQKGRSLNSVINAAMKKYGSDKESIQKTLKELTWPKILNNSANVFSDQELINHEKLVDMFQKDMQALGMETSFAKLEASFIFDLTSYQLQKDRMMSKGYLDVESLSNQYAVLKEKLPIAVRLGFLYEELFIYILSGDKEVVGSEQLFNIRNFQRYYFSDRLQQAFSTYEIFYMWRNNKTDFRSGRYTKFINKITSLMSAGCVVQQFRAGDESLEGVKKCQLGIYRFLAAASQESYWVDNEGEYLQVMFDAVDKAGIDKLAEQWSKGVFDITWSGLR